MHDYPLKQRTIGHVLADKARRVGDRTWLIFGRDRYSYARAHDLSTVTPTASARSASARATMSP